MRETRITWPEDTLGCPLRSAYRATVDPQFRRTEVEDGPPRYRRIRQEERRQIEVQFLWTLDQLDLFEKFHDTTLVSGIRWFMMPALTGRGMKPMVCHLIEGWQVEADQDIIDRYRVSFNVEAFHSTASLPPPWVSDVPVDAGIITVALPTDAFDGLEVTAARPTDVVDGTSPSVVGG